MVQKGITLSNIYVKKLILGGVGLGIDESGKKILISGGVIPESIVDVRVIKDRSNRIEAQLQKVIKKSPLEGSLPSHFQVYAGCRWLPIPYEKQLEIKEQQIREVFIHTPQMVEGVTWHPIVSSPEVYGYRNKVEFSWGKYISAREGVNEKYKFGFHESGQFDRIVDCTYCALGDETVNSIFQAFDAFARENRLPTYDVKTNIGFWRHLVIRRGKKTGETMVIVSVNTIYLGESQREEFKTALKQFFSILPVTSGYLLHNTGKADTVHGEYEHLTGTPVITEQLFDLHFEISPRSFFQTNTLGAESLYSVTRDMVKTQDAIVFDLYAGTGTIGMIMAKVAQKVYSVEIVPEASEDNIRNLKRNNITNVEVINAPVEKFVEEWKRLGADKNPDVIIVDPPRAGMHPDAPGIIRDFGPAEIIYVSCNPATLARDLALISPNGEYRVTDITPVDMFPHTHHIETVVRMEKV